VTQAADNEEFVKAAQAWLGVKVDGWAGGDTLAAFLEKTGRTVLAQPAQAPALTVRGKEKLTGVHPNLVRVVERAFQLTQQDFMVLEGVRTPERQAELYAQGRTKPGQKVTWTLKSNHFKNPTTGFGHAVDLVPFPVDWSHEKLGVVSKAMFAAAKELGIAIRWGADWDRDGNPREKGETDSPHFELFL